MHDKSRSLAVSALRTAARWRWLRPDWFILSGIVVVALASVAPCHGGAASVFRALSTAAIAMLFFMQGARLSRESILAGVSHWRLHTAIAWTTYGLFPLLGAGLIGMAHDRLPGLVSTGIIFLAVLPSTVQSSIAFTSIARGNVAGAVCAASASSLIGMALTPLMLGVLVHQHAGADFTGVGKILLQLFVPFAIGHAMRPRIGGWADRNRKLLAITDRSSILLVVYTAFSAAVIHGVWNQVPLATLAVIFVADAVLLAAAVAATLTACRVAGLSRADEAAVVLCGAQKSLVTGVPMANVLFSAAAVGVVLLPLMIYYQQQLFVCAWLARRYAGMDADTRQPSGLAQFGAWLRPVPQLVPMRVMATRTRRRLEK